jgi:AraC-like DNA-binding protein
MGYWHADEVVQRDPNSTAHPTTPSHEHLSEVREPYLRRLARQVGFEYQHLGTIDSLREAMLTPRFAENRRAPTDFAWVAAAVALLALLIGHWPTRRALGITSR